MATPSVMPLVASCLSCAALTAAVKVKSSVMPNMASISELMRSKKFLNIFIMVAISIMDGIVR